VIDRQNKGKKPVRDGMSPLMVPGGCWNGEAADWWEQHSMTEYKFLMSITILVIMIFANKILIYSTALSTGRIILNLNCLAAPVPSPAAAALALSAHGASFSVPTADSHSPTPLTL